MSSSSYLPARAMTLRCWRAATGLSLVVDTAEANILLSADETHFNTVRMLYTLQARAIHGYTHLAKSAGERRMQRWTVEYKTLVKQM